MSQERWHREIRERSAEQKKEDFWKSEPEQIPQIPGGKIWFISVKEGNKKGLPEGVYTETNIDPDAWVESSGLRDLIMAQLCLAMLEKKKNTLPGLYLDVGNSIKITDTFTSPFGGIVLKIEPALPTEVDESMFNLKTGQARGALVPNPDFLK